MNLNININININLKINIDLNLNINTYINKKSNYIEIYGYVCIFMLKKTYIYIYVHVNIYICTTYPDYSICQSFRVSVWLVPIVALLHPTFFKVSGPCAPFCWPEKVGLWRAPI